MFMAVGEEAKLKIDIGKQQHKGMQSESATSRGLLTKEDLNKQKKKGCCWDDYYWVFTVLIYVVDE